VKIWSLDPVLSEADEGDASKPKLLATLSDHYGAVNTVRFSGDGRFLASGSDDQLVCVHEHKEGQAPAAVFGEDTYNLENWKQRTLLRGHRSHVMDVGWSPDGSMLASCSLDNSVIVWEVGGGTVVARLEGHTSHVKGLSWDPIGRYLATQGDDKCLRIWSTEDWKPVAGIAKCFEGSATSSFSLRLCWSPEGSTLFAPNVLERPCQCAVAIQRGEWSCDIKLVGHHAPVVACAVNPRLFRAADSQGDKSEGSGSRFNQCVALGSQDKHLTVWLTAVPQPLLVAKNVFEAGVNDICWTPDGFSLVASSIDGTVATFTFTEEELGLPATREEMDSILASLYGGQHGPRSRPKFMESIAQLELEASAAAAKDDPRPPEPAHAPPPAPKPRTPAKPQALVEASVATPQPQPQSSSAAPQNGASTAMLQVESRTKDGRRRVAPVPISSPVQPRAAAEPHQARPLPEGSAGQPELLAARAAPAAPAASAQDESHGAWMDGAPDVRRRGMAPAARAQRREVIVPPRTTAFGPGRPPERSSDLASAQRASSAARLPARQSVTAENKGQGSTFTCYELTDGDERSAVLWEVSVGSPFLLVDAGESFVAAAFEDRTIRVFAAMTGRVLIPAVPLPCKAAALRAHRHKLLVAAGESVRLWDLQHQVLICEAELGSVFAAAGPKARVVDIDLSPKEEPVLILSTREAYVFHTGLRAWLRVMDADFPPASFQAQAPRRSERSSSAAAEPAPPSLQRPAGAPPSQPACCPAGGRSTASPGGGRARRPAARGPRSPSGRRAATGCGTSRPRLRPPRRWATTWATDGPSTCTAASCLRRARSTVSARSSWMSWDLSS